jgi:hypothetical protein
MQPSTSNSDPNPSSENYQHGQAQASTIETGQASSSTPLIAQDGDRIEEIWVLKVQEILERTKQDPYQQSQQLAALREQYLKTRYSHVGDLNGGKK